MKSVVDEHRKDIKKLSIVGEVRADAEIGIVCLERIFARAVEKTDPFLVENQMVTIGGGGRGILALGEERLFCRPLEFVEGPVGNVAIDGQLLITEVPYGDRAFRPGKHRS